MKSLTKNQIKGMLDRLQDHYKIKAFAGEFELLESNEDYDIIKIDGVLFKVWTWGDYSMCSLWGDVLNIDLTDKERLALKTILKPLVTARNRPKEIEELENKLAKLKAESL